MLCHLGEAFDMHRAVWEFRNHQLAQIMDMDGRV